MTKLSWEKITVRNKKSKLGNEATTTLRRYTKAWNLVRLRDKPSKRFESEHSSSKSKTSILS
jgi:hypothetical protein